MNPYAFLLPLIGIAVLVWLVWKFLPRGKFTGNAPVLAHTRFAALYGLGKFVAGLGWVVVALSVLGGLAAGASAGDAVAALIIVGGSVCGIMIVAFGQTMQCLVAIEENTRSTANHTATSTVGTASTA